MNSFDGSIIHFFNSFAQTSPSFDKVVLFVSDNHLIKAAVFVCLIWWLWFRKDENQQLNREKIISILISSSIAMGITRILVHILPYRTRPLHEAGLHFILPEGVNNYMYSGRDSSFPSDHAVLFFALAFGLFLISRKLGIFAFIYTTIFVVFPRVYLGFHYPTDILCGALLGIVITYLGCSKRVRDWTSGPVLKWADSHQGLFYTLFFLFTYQLADMFDNSRAFLGIVKSLLHNTPYQLG